MVVVSEHCMFSLLHYPEPILGMQNIIGASYYVPPTYGWRKALKELPKETGALWLTSKDFHKGLSRT